jgi:H+/Cl- antiporter ClcA
MSITPLVALGTLVFTFVNFLRFFSARNWSAVLTQIIAWVAGMAGVFLMRATDFAAGIKIGDKSLDKVGFWSALLLGLLATSLLSTVNEVKKALDNNDSSKVPPLLPNQQGTQR